MKTIGLENNDLYVDDLGNIGVKDGLERLAQDVASSVKVWKGELPRDVERGIDYNDIDGIQETLNHDIIEQAKLVDGVDEKLVLPQKFVMVLLAPKEMEFVGAKLKLNAGGFISGIS